MEKPSQEALDHAAQLYDLLQERGFDLEQLREREVGKVALWQMGKPTSMAWSGMAHNPLSGKKGMDTNYE